MIIRIKDITGVKRSDSEKFSDFILKKEGILNQIKLPNIVNVDDFKVVFQELKILEKNIIVECENIDISDFYIGKIIKVNNNSVLFLHFDGVGEWREEPSLIPFKEITSISFDKRYINIISKYIKPCELQ